MNLLLERFAYSPDGTFGKLYIEDFVCYTCEKPWEGNAKRVSCIPEGNYTMELRQSGVVSDSTAGEFVEGWEIKDVPGRTFIMLHPANWPSELAGCISQGRHYAIMRKANGVTHSRDTFREMMNLLRDDDQHTITIRQYSPQYP